MGDVKRSELVNASKNLNDLLGLEPPIDIKAKPAILTEKLIQATKLLTPEDELPKAVQKTLVAIGALVGAEEEETTASPKAEADLPTLVSSTKKLGDLKEIIAEHKDVFKGIKDLDSFKGLPGVKALKDAMIEIVGEPEKKEKPKPAPKPKAKKAPKAPRITKKSVVIEHLEKKGGATLDEMAAAITEAGVDPDTERNRKTALLWIRKIGFKVERKEDRYMKAAVQ